MCSKAEQQLHGEITEDAGHKPKARAGKSEDNQRATKRCSRTNNYIVTQNYLKDMQNAQQRMPDDHENNLKNQITANELQGDRAC